MKRAVIAAALAVAANAAVMKRDLVPQTIGGWTAMGCWSDDPLARVLPQLVNVGEGISGTQCQQQCQDDGYLYAGNEDGGQCYCYSYLENGSVQVPDTDCNMTCPADSTQPCGAPNRMNIYYQGPSQRYSVAGWDYYGCVSDSVHARGLRYPIQADNMTPQLCATSCAAAGYSLAAVEWTSECYCDNYLQNNQSLADPVTCNMPCAGDSSVACGGAGRMNLFAAVGTVVQAQPIANHDVVLSSGWSYSRCLTDAVDARALSSYITGPQTGMTTEYCVSGCAAAGFSFAGTSYGDECYCGNEIDNGQTTADDGCSMACSGDNSEICGGSNRLSLYQYQPPTWSYQGCFSGVNLPLYKDYGTYAVGQCESDCQAAGYDAVGWRGTQCFCGHQSAMSNIQAADGGSCGYDCYEGTCTLAPNTYVYNLGYGRLLAL